jgi:hypothetical protein
VPRVAAAVASATTNAINRRRATFVIAAIVAIVVVPLTISSINIVRDNNREIDVRDAAKVWATDVGWELERVSTREGNVIVEFEGAFPVPDPASLRAALIERGIDPAVVRAEFLPKATVELAGSG